MNSIVIFSVDLASIISSSIDLDSYYAHHSIEIDFFLNLESTYFHDHNSIIHLDFVINNNGDQKRGNNRTTW